MPDKKKAIRDISTRITAVVLVLLMFVTFLNLSPPSMRVSAAGSDTFSGGETISITLQDSGWQGSNIRVRQLDASDAELSTDTQTPSFNKVTVTGAAGASELVIEKLNTSKIANLAGMKDIINSAAPGKTVVFFDNTSTAWSDIRYYAWSKVSSYVYMDADWPSRKSMTRLGSTQFYYAVIDKNASLSGPYENIIFTGSSKQTVDLLLKPSTADDVQVYSSVTNSWVAYTDVDRSLTVSAADRADDSHNDLYVVSKTSAKWSKYNSSSLKKTVYFKPNSPWGTAYVHYDDDDDEPFYTSVQMDVYSSSPLIFMAEVYYGAMVSFSNGADFKTSTKKDQGSVFGDENEPVYVSKDRSWTTLNNALTSDTVPDGVLQVNRTNFSEVSLSGGGKVVGFNAYYYDYLSDSERLTGWRNNLNDEDFSGPAGRDGSLYRMQFSQFNDDIKNVAQSNTDWRYPLFFGDDYNTNSYITSYYNDLKNSRSPAISHANFNAANNSNYLGGDNSRSVMGLAESELRAGSLMMTDTLVSPYFDYDWLLGTGSQQREVLYILDNGNLGQNNIYCNFWGSGKPAITGSHPMKVTNGSVTIGGKTGILYCYIVDPGYTSVQLANSTSYGNNFWDYQESGEWMLSRFTDIVLTDGSRGSVTSSTYKSGIQSISSKRAEIINSKFPFVETIDQNTKVKTYTFDSNGSSRKDNISLYVSESNPEHNGLFYYNTPGWTGKLDGNNGFFPLNSTGHETRNYGFGVRVEMDFTLPMNGMLTSTKPAEFHYSGDDDVWVFVDGQLILDLGGAHTPTTGSINFGAGTNLISAKSDKVYGEFNTGTGGTDVAKNGSSVTKTFTLNNTDPTKKHHMTVFYMERGTNDSNLRIEFSIQPILNEMNVYKEVEIDEVNAGIADEVDALAKDVDFGFTLLQNGSGYGGTNGKMINTVHADDTTTTDTVKNGQFILKHYEEAMFHNDTDLTYGSTMKITEAAPTLFTYDTNIVVKDNLNGDQIASAESEQEISFSFKNGQQDPEERTSLAAEFENVLKTASLTLTKELYQLNTTTPSTNPVPFEFTVQLDLDQDGTYETYDLDYRYAGHEEVYTASNGAMQMRPDQTVIIEHLPVGTPYRIAESEKPGYQPKGSGVMTGTVPEGGKTVAFQNEERPATRDIDITKTLDGELYSGTEFSFRCELVKRIKSPTDITTTGLGTIYATNDKYTVRPDGTVGFDPFNIIPNTDNVADYIFKISEFDKSETQPQYSYDSTIYYAKISVTENNVANPVFYTDADCTRPAALDEKGNPVFANRVKKGKITVNKVDSDDQPLTGTQFAMIKVSSKNDVDAHLTPEAINALIEANRTDADKVTLKTTEMHGAAASVIFDDLYIYRHGGQFVYNTESQQLEWSDTADPTAAQTYCIFEYSPTDGYLPNYTKSYVVLADKDHFEETFGYVDGMIVMPNSSGSGNGVFVIIGSAILTLSVMLAAAYLISRRAKPKYVGRHQIK